MRAYAKINLCLRVKNKENGYHNIDSIMSKIDIFDDVDLNIRNNGNSANALYNGRNSALLALELIQRLHSIDYYGINIRKGIPIEAGLGGSSTDAGSVIRYFLNNGTLTANEALKVASLVGKDVAFFLDDNPKRVRGLQDDISIIKIASPLYFILIKPKGGVSTADCYKHFDLDMHQEEGDPDKLLKGLMTGDLNLIKNNMFNDLERPAIKLNPNIKEALLDLNRIGSLKAMVSGSGSAVIGLFNSKEEANRQIRLLKPSKYEMVKVIQTLNV